MKTIHMIKRKVDSKRIRDGCDAGKYYQNLTSEFRRKIPENTDAVMVFLIPSEPITDIITFEILLSLQSEVTNIAIIPETKFIPPKEKLDEIVQFLKFEQVFLNLSNKKDR